MQTIKKVFALIVVFVVSYSLMAIAALNGWQAVKLIFLGFAAAVTLAIVLQVVKLFGFFVKWSMASVLYCLAGLAVIGWLAYIGEISGFVSYIFTTIFAGALILLIVRRIAKKAQKSVIMGEIFAFVSDYKIRLYLKDTELQEKETAINLRKDEKNLYVILADLGFSKAVAREAAAAAISEMPHASLEDKTKAALRLVAQN